MNTAVIDASVVAAALFRETHGDMARVLFASAIRLHAPEFIYAEAANVIWKRYRAGEIDQTDAADLLSDVMALPLATTPSQQLAGPALSLAMRTGRTAYDCLYVALALELKTTVITNDRRLVNALSGGPLKSHVVWLGQPR